jgi:hypothetical protein
MQLAPGAGPRTPVHACVRLHMEGWTWRAFHTCITQVVSIYKYWVIYSNFMFILCSHIAFFCQYWCQRWRWKAHHLRLELARAEQALCAVWSCVISWRFADGFSVPPGSPGYPLNHLQQTFWLQPTLSIETIEVPSTQSISPCWWRHGIRDGEHIARQQWMCRVTSPLPDPLEKTRRLERWQTWELSCAGGWCRIL